LGNVNASVEAFEHSAALNPENVDLWLNWSLAYFEQGDIQEAVELVKRGLDELPAEALLHYRLTAYLTIAGKYKEAFNSLENALILDFDKHTVLYDFFPNIETQQALFKIISKYKNDSAK
jgi:tetratricopeptide (TPR) repeat protein